MMQLDGRVNASGIGFVQQNPENQIVTDKVWHELAFGLESLGFDNPVIRRRVSEMANYFGISTWFRKNTSELSGGQKQLLNLASIMAMHPNLIILDEPTSQLDPIAATEFLGILKRINQDLGITIVLSEHRLEEVYCMADRVLVMEEGKIATFDTPVNVARFLCSKGKRHEMFEGLPSPVKIFADVEGDLNGGQICPLTVREGRKWLSDKIPKVTVDKLEEEKTDGVDPQKVIELTDVWFRYSKDGEDIVRDLSMKVHKGELYCLMGGNGAGKSTVLQIICGRNRPYRGKIVIGQKEIGRYKGNELFTNCLGVLPQNPASVFTEITLEEELYEALYYEELPKDEKIHRIEEMAKLMELSGMEKRHPYDLSGGEQQRLALGKILLREPKILLLDEPTKGLDPFFKATLSEIFGRLKAQGVTIFMVTHDLEFCGEYADRCAMFFDGQVVTSDPPKNFSEATVFIQPLPTGWQDIYSGKRLRIRMW